SGSTIAFSGPFSSTNLNIKAEKEERVKLYDLLNETEKQAADATMGQSGQANDESKENQRLLVKLYMTGSLENPTYNYKLELPDNRGIGTLAHSKFTRINLNQNELLEQVASLLILGTFLPSEDAWRSAVSTAANNVGNIFSSAASTQLTNFFGKLLNDDKLSINLKYDNYNLNTYGSSGMLIRNEFSLAVKKSLFQDRLIIGVGSSYDWGRPSATTPNNKVNLSGDFRLQYLLTPDGRIRINVFGTNNY